MANYNLNQFRNTYILNDQTGSLFDSGGPTGSYTTGQNYYVLIAPQYATGTLTLNVVSGVLDANDAIRIYNGIPSTSSYAGLVTNSSLLAVLSGNLSSQTITASSGRAYIRFSGRTNSTTVGAASGFQIDWTGSGIYTVDSSSGVVRNRYAATFPKESYLTFAPGMFTGSSTLGTNKDILIGMWARYDYDDATANTRGLLTIGDTGTGNQGITITKFSLTTDYDLRLLVRDANNNLSTQTSTDMLIGGGASNTTTRPPQWHHYGWAIRRTSATSSFITSYRDGSPFASGTANLQTAISSSLSLIAGQYRTGGVISTGQSFTGSLDDVFLATVETGSTLPTYHSFFAAMFNSGNWADPTVQISSSFSGKNGAVIFNWRFEETGSMLNTRDWGSFGNIHSASTMVTGGGSVFLTTTGSGQSYTAYSSLAYSASAAVLNPGVFNWENTAISVYETASFATVNVIRTSGSDGAVTASLFYSSSAGTAVPKTGSAGQLIFSASQTVAQVVFPQTDDLVDEPDDPTYITFSSFTSDYGTATTGSNGTLILTIIDNETGSISFTTGSASVYENTSSYYVGVQRLYGGDGPTSAIISYGGSAVEFTDYRIIYNGFSKIEPFEVSWAAGDTSTKYITASIYDNTETDTSRNIIFGIDSSTSSSIGPTGSFQLNILDYEEGVASISSSSYSFGESSIFATIPVNRDSGSQGPLSVNYQTIDGTALDGLNYTAVNGTLYWDSGDSTPQNVSIPILYDNLQTSNLNFRLLLSNLSTGSYSSYPSAITSSTITIIDQEPGTFKISSSSYSVIEGQSLTVTVERYSGSFGDVSVNVRTSDGSAVAGVDYNSVNTNLSFANSETSKTFTISTINNSTDISSPLQFDTYINSLSPDYGTAFKGNPSSSVITIIDNESGSIRFTSPSYTGSQNSSITFYVERYNGGDFTATASISVSVSSTAVAGVDYSNIFPYTISWADQETGSKPITLTTLGPWSPSRVLNLSIGSLTNITSGSIMSSSILIQSNVLTQSSNQYSDYSTDFTINKYVNLSNQFTRRTEQVPFSLGTNPLIRLQQAYSAST